MSNRLKQSIAVAYQTFSGDWLCNCQQYTARTPTYDVSGDHVLAHVALSGTQPGVTLVLDVTVLRTDAGWLADDLQCNGLGPSTSVLNPNPAPCS